MNWQALNLETEPETRQLYQSIFALEALLGDRSQNWQRVAEHLNLTPILSDWLNHWNQSGLQSSISADEARSLVLIICHLARQNQALIRRGVNLVEQLTQQNRPLDQVTLLRDYLEGFSQRYQRHFNPDSSLSTEQITPLALKSLIDLLFYSQSHSSQQFWSALLA